MNRGQHLSLYCCILVTTNVEQPQTCHTQQLMSATLLGGYYAMLICPKSIKTRGLCGLLRNGTRQCMCYLVVLLHFGDNQCGTAPNMPYTTVDECHPTRRLLSHAYMPQIYPNPRTLWPSAQWYQTMHVLSGFIAAFW
jgi:hypothetical protein